MRWLVLCAAISLVTSTATAAPRAVDVPFGITLGQKIETLDAMESKEIENLYEFRSVPNPHPLLVRYTARASASAGVCSVSGYPSKDSDASRDIEVLREYMTTMLGDPTTHRLSESTRIWVWRPKDSPVYNVTLYRIQSPGGLNTKLEFASENPGSRCGPPRRKRSPPRIP
jgi:hypothetical protein